MSNVIQNLPLGGESYDQFILLPAGAQTPSLVEQPEPDFGTAQYTEFKDLESLLAQTPLKLYLPKTLPTDAVFHVGYRMDYPDTGDVEIVVVYAKANPITRVLESYATISAKSFFPTPFPIRAEWAYLSPENTPPHFQIVKGQVMPQKIRSTPSPGVLLTGLNGFSVIWIENDVQYQLVVENTTERTELDNVINSLS